MEVDVPHPIKIEPEEEETLLADEPFSSAAAVSADIKPNILLHGPPENDEEIDIMGTSDNEEEDMPMSSSSNGTAFNSSSNRPKRVSFAHPTSSSTVARPTRVIIPPSAIKPTRTKYVKDPNKKDMKFNTAQDYNYMDDELFFKKEEIPLPFEDVRLYEHGLEMRPLGEQRYVVDAITTAFNVLQQEARKIQGQLRALNARSGRIRKQIDREEEAIARGEDPSEAPRSSKGLLENGMVFPAVRAAVQPAPRPRSSAQRRKKRIVRRKPQRQNTGNETTQSTGNIKLATAAAVVKPKEEANDSDYE